MPTRGNGDIRFFDRACSWVAEHVFGYHVDILQIKIEAPVGVGRPNKPVKSYRTGAYSFYSLGVNQIGFTGSYEMYQALKGALESKGFRYTIRYFGTRITPRQRAENAGPKTGGVS